MKELLKEIKEYQFTDLTEEQSKKLKGIASVGKKVEIEWEGRAELDYGYILRLPEQDEDDEILDLIVHVTNVNNSDGIDEAPEVWTHLLNLLTNKRVISIKII